MLKGTTESGFTFEVLDKNLNNYYLLEVISEVDSNPLLMPKVLNLLLGDEQKNKLLDHLKDEDGTISIDTVGGELKEIMLSGKEGKNS